MIAIIISFLSLFSFYSWAPPIPVPVQNNQKQHAEHLLKKAASFEKAAEDAHFRSGLLYPLVEYWRKQVQIWSFEIQWTTENIQSTKSAQRRRLGKSPMFVQVSDFQAILRNKQSSKEEADRKLSQLEEDLATSKLKIRTSKQLATRYRQDARRLMPSL